MWLDMLAKDENSNPGGCPSVYFAKDGSLVVQGPLVHPDTHGNLENVLPGELSLIHISEPTRPY